MCRLRKGNKTEFLSQLSEGRNRKQLNIRVALTAKELSLTTSGWIVSELCSESDCRLVKSNDVIDLPNFTVSIFDFLVIYI